MNDKEYKLGCENGETEAHDPPHVVPQQHLKRCNDHMKQSENQTQRQSVLVVPSISVEASNHPVSTCKPPAAKRKRSAQIHNLFEKKRRDKIKKKMRTLQALIPNCDKVDNASILDEAIDYMKNLQMQLQMQLLIMSMGVMLQLPPFPPFNFMTMFPTGAAQPLMTSSSGTTNYNMMAMAMAAGGSSSSATTGSSLSHINMLTGEGFPHPHLLINPLRMNMINFLNPQWPPTIHPHTHPQATKELFKDSA